jgi:uncharacterized protein Usg
MYRRPDHRWLLQTYVWQDFDLFPKFPELNKFLNFWIEKLDGPLHSVIVAHTRLIKPAQLNAIDDEFRLHQGRRSQRAGQSQIDFCASHVLSASCERLPPSGTF